MEFSVGAMQLGVLFKVSQFAFGPYAIENSMSKVKLIEAGVLNDAKAYSVQIGFFFTYPGGDSDPVLQICDGSYCVGFGYWRTNYIESHGGTDNSADLCTRTEATSFSSPPVTTNWNIRLEIHPNSTSGITYVGTYSMTYEYSERLKPSQGLRFKVCRFSVGETFKFHLFELAVHVNE